MYQKNTEKRISRSDLSTGAGSFPSPLSSSSSGGSISCSALSFTRPSRINTAIAMIAATAKNRRI